MWRFARVLRLLRPTLDTSQRCPARLSGTPHQAVKPWSEVESPRAFVLALAVIASSWSPVQALEHRAMFRAAMASVTQQEIREHAGVLAGDTLEGREAGSRGGLAAARYLQQRLRHEQLQPGGDHGTWSQRFGANYQNILAILPGTDPELRDEFLVVSGHYDHVGYGTRRNSRGPVGYIHNGADDNASGVSAMLEVINGLQQVGWQPRRSILFAFWDGEEKGLLGSWHWVRHPTVRLEQVKLIVNIDMIGRMENHRLEVGGTRSATGLRSLLASRDLPSDLWLDFDWELKRNSDHWPFFRSGVPVVYLHTGEHDDYHRPSDDVEKLNMAGLRAATVYLLDVVARLASEDTIPQLRAMARAESNTVRRSREAPLANLASRWNAQTEWQPAQHDVAASFLVTALPAASHAEPNGLRVGDHIVAIEGRPVNHPDALPAALWQAASEIELTVRAANGANSARKVTVPLAGQPVALGISWREDVGDPSAVIITRVVPAAPAARAGLQLHDRIRALNGESVQGQDDLHQRITRLLEQRPDSFVLEVERRGRVTDMQIDLGLPGKADDRTL